MKRLHSLIEKTALRLKIPVISVICMGTWTGLVIAMTIAAPLLFIAVLVLGCVLLFTMRDKLWNDQ